MMMYSSDTFFIDESPTSVPPRVEITVLDEVPQPSNESSDDSKHDGHRDGYEGAPVALIPDRNAIMEGPQNTPKEAEHFCCTTQKAATTMTLLICQDT